jgi:hypothetical protein
MTGETAERYVYLIDRDDRIVYVSPEWLRFAVENDARELTTENVLGQPIWNFVTGDDSCAFYTSIFRNLRARGTEISIPFRCDSPTVVRQMNLILRLLPDNSIECEGVLLNSRIREPITVLFRWVIRTDKTIPICSLCRRLSVQGEWLELRDAIARKGIANVAPAPRLEETVCPSCNCITE